MFFSRKKARTQAAAETATFYARTIGETQADLATAEKVPEAGERYLAFLEIETKIQKLIDEATQKADTQTEDIITHRKMFTVLPGAGMVMGGIIAMMTVMTAAPAVAGVILIGGPIVAATGYGTMTFGMFTKGGKPVKKIIESKEGFCTALNALLEHATSQKDSILESNLEGLLASPRLETLCEKSPPVQTAFTKAAMKEHIFTPPVRLDKLQPNKPKQ